MLCNLYIVTLYFLLAKLIKLKLNFDNCFLRTFLFPNDLQLELEYWAETGEYSSEELQQV